MWANFGSCMNPPIDSVPWLGVKGGIKVEGMGPCADQGFLFAAFQFLVQTRLHPTFTHSDLPR